MKSKGRLPHRESRPFEFIQYTDKLLRCFRRLLGSCSLCRRFGRRCRSRCCLFRRCCRFGGRRRRRCGRRSSLGGGCRCRRFHCTRCSGRRRLCTRGQPHVWRSGRLWRGRRGGSGSRRRCRIALRRCVGCGRRFSGGGTCIGRRTLLGARNGGRCRSFFRGSRYRQLCVTAILPSCYPNCANGDNNGDRGSNFGAGAHFYRRRSIVTKIV